MRYKIFIGAVMAVAAALVSEGATSYSWKATGGGFVDFTTQAPLDGETVYLLDGNKCSPSNLVENVKAGSALSDLPFVLAKGIQQGVIYQGAEFTYANEPAGTVWSAYMAVQMERNGKRYVYVSPSVDVEGNAMGLTTAITFESQAETSGRLVEGKTYSMPGWYEVAPVVSRTICPGRGTDALEVAADSESAAITRVTVVSPNAGAVSDVDYAKYFKLNATPTTPGNYLVRAELDREALDLDKTVVSFAAQLSDLAKKAGTTVTVEIECKPGLSYRILTASAVAGPYARGETTPLTTGSKTEVKVALPEGDKAFFKIGVEACPEEVK